MEIRDDGKGSSSAIHVDYIITDFSPDRNLKFIRIYGYDAETFSTYIGVEWSGELRGYTLNTEETEALILCLQRVLQVRAENEH